MKLHVNRAPRAGDAALPLRPVEAPGPGASRQPPLAVLLAAAAAVRDGAADGDGGFRRDEAAPLLDWLVTAIAAATDGKPPEHGGPAVNALGLHLLALLRAEVVRAWRSSETPPDQEEIFGLLDAIEEVRRAILPDWSNGFASQLAGPDGLGLVVGLAHDLRSPLTSILFLAETLARGRSGLVNLLQRKQLRLVYGAALALNSLASDVIELARGGDQLIEKESEVFSLAELLEWLRDMVLPIGEEKGVQIRHILPLTDRRIGRPLALSRVLLNLLTNALKFTEKGFVEVRGTAKGLTRVEFSVRDTGRGISPEAIATLYEPFSHVPAASQRGVYRFSGTGLGLALCRRLVQAMGSELKYETRPEWGTRFYFELELPPANLP